jgi:4-hydroxyphenylpyruvate dioxygenase
MADEGTIGLLGVESFEYYVHELDRSRRFYTEMMDFAEVAATPTADIRNLGEASVVFNAGEITVVCTSPRSDACAAREFLSRHPDGIGRITFQVEDAERAFRTLEARGGTPRTRVLEGEGMAYFDLVTPFGDTLFRFLERRGSKSPGPGIQVYDRPTGGRNRMGFHRVDHITSNFMTMSPALLWMEHVMGLQQFWDVEFHTTDVSEEQDKGSGLRSVVMHDPASKVKFANNEPWRPFFEQSQIYVFNRELGGDGVQHLALTVGDIIPAVRELRSRGVQFMPTPGSYYDMLPRRLEELGIGSIEEDIAVLRELEVLVDGAGRNSYLLQIFLKESAGLYGDPKAGPFFYEVIQRKGDEGFGAGNFRALFESIEREQQASGKV